MHTTLAWQTWNTQTDATLEFPGNILFIVSKGSRPRKHQNPRFIFKQALRNHIFVYFSILGLYLFELWQSLSPSKLAFAVLPQLTFMMPATSTTQEEEIVSLKEQVAQLVAIRPPLPLMLPLLLLLHPVRGLSQPPHVFSYRYEQVSPRKWSSYSRIERPNSSSLLFPLSL